MMKRMKENLFSKSESLWVGVRRGKSDGHERRCKRRPSQSAPHYPNIAAQDNRATISSFALISSVFYISDTIMIYNIASSMASSAFVAK